MAGDPADLSLGDAIVETVRTPLLVLDAQLRVERANQMFYRLFEESPASTEGRLVFELGGGQWEIPELRELIEEVLPHELEFEDFEVTREFPGIGRRTVLLNARRVPAGGRRGAAILLAFEDVTDRRVAEAKVERYTRELERSNQALQDFASIASHDLQEPLRKILMFGDRLRRSVEGTLPERAEDSLQRLVDAAQRMQSLIDGLLQYARVATRARPFEPVDLAAVADAVVADLESAVHRSGATVTRDALPTLAADEMQMRQLLQNLLTNALKFRQPDVPPRVHISHRLLDEGRTVEVSVRDNGIGVDTAHAERIFGVFARLHRREQYEGSGIGLAICRRIVERHGGSIHASPGPDGGSVFTTVLPMQHEEDVQA